MKDREPRGMSRRKLLGGLLATVVLTACGKPEKPVTSALVPSKTEVKAAQQIRQEINAYIEANLNDLSDNAISRIFRMELDLYNAVFGKPVTKVELILARNEELKPTEKAYDYPFGRAGYIMLNTRTNSVENITAVIAVGKSENYDPKIGKLRVMDALLKHELVHTQTNPVLRPVRVKVGDFPEFTAQRTRGLKWVDTVVPGNSGTEVGYFFDEINTQFLAEYVNDPSGQDNLFQRMADSPFQKHTISSVYTEGAKQIGKIYKALGITPEEVQGYHYSANPAGLLNKIDSATMQKGIKLPFKPSTVLLVANPVVSAEELHLSPAFTELVNSYK